jgi:hypothetical protein
VVQVVCSSLVLACLLSVGWAAGARPAPYRRHLPDYAGLIEEARQWPERGVAAYLPPGARSQGDENIFDMLSQLAVPLVMTDRFPREAPAAFFSMHSLADRQLVPRMRSFLAAGNRAVITSRLAARLGGLPSRYAGRIFVLSTRRETAGLLKLPQTTIDHLRNFVLHPIGLRIQAPPRVTIALYGQEAIVIENLNPFAAGVNVTFLRSSWPELAEIRTANGDIAIRVDYNQARIQLAPQSTRLLRIVPQSRT